jgi:hypothetical protein
LKFLDSTATRPPVRYSETFDIDKLDIAAHTQTPSPEFVDLKRKNESLVAENGVLSAKLEELAVDYSQVQQQLESVFKELASSYEKQATDASSMFEQQLGNTGFGAAATGNAAFGGFGAAPVMMLIMKHSHANLCLSVFT